MITLIKSNATNLRLNLTKRSESLILKVAGILFIGVLNSNGLSAQSNQLVCTTQTLPITILPKIKNVLDVPKHKVYTVFLTKNFPLLEGATNGLNSMEEGDLADFSLLEDLPVNSTVIIESSTTKLSKLKTVTKNPKTKIAQKLNS